LIIVSGSMVPDMSHDSMWYHLSVPQQWAFEGRIRPLPDVMPSCYPLAVEAFYAILLPIGGEIACTLFYGICFLLLLMVVGIGARELCPRGALAAAVLWIPLLAATRAAPIPAGNDMLAALFLLSGALLLWPWNGGLPAWRMAFMAGATWGLATAAKPVCVGFWPLLLGAAILTWQAPWRGRLRLGALVAGSAAVGYLPWLLIGVGSSGLPVFPLGGSIFPIRNEYLPTWETSRRLNSTYPLTLAGLLESVTVGLPHKIHLASRVGSVLTFLTPLVAGVALALGTGIMRWTGLLVLLPYAASILLQGHNEVLRYYGVLFPLGVLPAAALMERARGHTRHYPMLVGLLALASMGSWARNQHQVANFRTIQWDYLPILTEARRNEYATRTETGGYFQAFAAMRHLIPPTERVFLPDCKYPFYLHRPALWNDEAVEPGIRHRWMMMTPEEAIALIRSENLRWLILMEPALPERTPTESLVRRGILQPVDLPEETHPMVLYRIALPAG
jgi:hypothetical protein